MGVPARQHFLVTLGDENSGGAASVVLSTCCTTPSGALQVRDALAAEGKLAAVSTVSARSEAQVSWWQSAELLTLALLVLPVCCHSAAMTILADELSVEAAAKASSVCFGSAVTIKYAPGWFFDGRRSDGLTPLQLRVGLAGFGVATATMAAFVAWVLAMKMALLTVVLCVVIFAWAITSACMVAPLLLSSAEYHQARHYETLKQLRSTAAALAKVPLLQHHDLRELENSAYAHSLEACFCVGCHATRVAGAILRLLSRRGSSDRGIRARRHNH
eukprot:COSAG02_NODE_7295_length_3080_cov_3.527675_1_plen_274_part_00